MENKFSGGSMRIALIIALFPPKWLAGTEIATYNLAKHLAKQAHEVHVITSLDENLPSNSMIDGFNVHRIKCPQFRIVKHNSGVERPKIRVYAAFIFFVKTMVALHELNPDIIHVQGIDIGIIGFFSKFILRKPYGVWGRGDDVYLPWPFKGFISKMVLRSALVAISLTDDMKNKMCDLHEREIIMIPNGIDIDMFTGLSKFESRNMLHLSQNEKILLFVGRLQPIKGVKYLIDAMGHVNKRDSKIKLLVVGFGAEFNDLNTKVENLSLSNNIILVGEVPYEKISIYMAAADVFVLPSLSEGFPGTLLEAMASSLPVITTNVAGLPEIIKDGINGFIVEPANSMEIATKVLKLFENPKLINYMGCNNKINSIDYGWDVICNKFITVYKKQLSKEDL